MNEVERWCWRLLPVALLLAGWAVARGSETGDQLLPVIVTSLTQDWDLAVRLTGRPL